VIPCPYPGLRPFRRDESEFFFGREEQVDQLLERLQGAHLVAVVGTSGCGKSSLVRAGLLAALEAGFMASAGARWCVADMKPGISPMQNLAEALLPYSVLGKSRAGDSGSREFLLATLRRGPLGLLEALQETPLDKDINLLLLVDQFEEIFRYRQQGGRNEADAFVALLLATARELQAPVYVVITMRSDYLGHCAMFNGLPEAINGCQFLVPRLSREQRREAIAAPAEVVGAQIDPALVTRLLNDMEMDARRWVTEARDAVIRPDIAEVADQLPLLQHTLMRMWTVATRSMPAASPGAPVRTGSDGRTTGVVLTLDHYQDEEVGGSLSEALARHAGAALREIRESDRSGERERIAERLFRALTGSATGERDTRNPVELQQVADVANVAPQRVADVVEVFRRPDRSFLTPPAGVPLRPGTVLDISHESLIRQWPVLARWAEEEAESARTYRNLEYDAINWKRGRSQLLQGLNLANALDWRRREQLTPTWARRYSDDTREGGFVAVTEFLAASEAAVARARRRRRFAAVLMFGVLVLAAVVALNSVERAIRARGSEKLGNLAQFHLNSGEMRVGLLLSLEASRRADTIASQNALIAALLTMERPHFKGDALQRVGEDIPAASQESRPSTVAISPSGTVAWGACAKGDPTGRRCLESTIRWSRDASRGDAARLSGIAGGVTSLALSADGRMLVAGTALDGRSHVLVWDLADDATLRYRRASPAVVNHVALSPDGRLAVTGGCARLDQKQQCRGGHVMLWNASSGSPIVAPAIGRQAVLATAIDPRGTWITFGGAEGVTLWNREDGRRVEVLITDRRPGYAVTSLAFDPSSTLLAGGGNDGVIRLWRWDGSRATSVINGELRRHEGAVLSLSFREAKGEVELVSGSADHTTGTWIGTWRIPAAEGAGVVSLAGHWGRDAAGSTVSLDSPATLSPDARRVAAACGKQDGDAGRCRRGEIRVWDASTGRLEVSLAGEETPIVGLTWSPNGKSLAAVHENRRASLWSLDAAPPRFRRLPAEQVYGVAFVSDTDLVTGGCGRTSKERCERGEVKRWSVADASLVGRVEAHDAPILGFAISGKRRTMASVGGDNQIMLWDLPTLGKTGERKWVPLTSGASLSPDGGILAGGRQNSVLVMRADRGTHWLPPLADKHGSPVSSVAFSGDGRTLASSSLDGAIMLWDIESGLPTVPEALRRHQGGVLSLVMGRDGRMLTSVSLDGTVVHWNLTPAAVQAQTCKLAGRNLDQDEWDRHVGEPWWYRKGCPNLAAGKNTWSRQWSEVSDNLPVRAANLFIGRIREIWIETKERLAAQ
jgi:WD40 repeat protein